MIHFVPFFPAYPPVVEPAVLNPSKDKYLLQNAYHIRFYKYDAKGFFQIIEVFIYYCKITRVYNLVLIYPSKSVVDKTSFNIS